MTWLQTNNLQNLCTHVTIITVQFHWRRHVLYVIQHAFLTSRTYYGAISMPSPHEDSLLRTAVSLPSCSHSTVKILMTKMLCGSIITPLKLLVSSVLKKRIIWIFLCVFLILCVTSHLIFARSKAISQDLR